MHEAEHGADDPHRRGKAAGLLERGRTDGVPRGHPIDLGFHDHVDHLRVGAIDDQLQGVAREAVVDLLELGVERKQSVAARLVSERDEEVQAAPHVGRFCGEDQLVQAGDALHRLHPHAGKRDPARSTHDDQQSLDVQERSRAGPIHHGAEAQGQKRRPRFRSLLQPSFARFIGRFRRYFSRKSRAFLQDAPR